MRVGPQLRVPHQWWRVPSTLHAKLHAFLGADLKLKRDGVPEREMPEQSVRNELAASPVRLRCLAQRSREFTDRATDEARVATVVGDTAASQDRPQCGAVAGHDP